jgi:hypothetical protein
VYRYTLYIAKSVAVAFGVHSARDNNDSARKYRRVVGFLGDPSHAVPHTVLFSGKIFASAAGQPYVHALAIQGDRIEAIGDSSQIRRLGSCALLRVRHFTESAQTKSYCSPPTILDSEPLRQDFKSLIENGQGWN